MQQRFYGLTTEDLQALAYQLASISQRRENGLMRLGILLHAATASVICAMS